MEENSSGVVLQDAAAENCAESSEISEEKCADITENTEDARERFRKFIEEPEMNAFMQDIVAKRVGSLRSKVEELQRLLDDKDGGKDSDDGSAEAQGGDTFDDLKPHFDAVAMQAIEYRAKNPEFNFLEEMKNPAFAVLVGPNVKLSVEQAYNATHFEEILDGKVREAAQAATKAVANSVQAGRSFPSENGQEQKASSPFSGRMYSDMSKDEREAYEKLLKDGKIVY